MILINNSLLVRLCPIKVGNPFVFHTSAAVDRNKGKGNNAIHWEDGDFWMYYSAGSTHLADSNIEEPLHLGLGQ